MTQTGIQEITPNEVLSGMVTMRPVKRFRFEGFASTVNPLEQ
jgi:hypothetical protein